MTETVHVGDIYRSNDDGRCFIVSMIVRRGRGFTIHCQHCHEDGTCSPLGWCEALKKFRSHSLTIVRKAARA